MKLKKLRRLNESCIELSWDDGHVGPVDLPALREACPCAGCQGETVLLKRYEPVREANSDPQKFALLAVDPVGSYALKLTWGDGHDQGLYTWEHLRSLCGCDACRAGKESNPLA